MVLHIVNRSPYSSDALQSCLRVISPQDGVLLIEDGVYAAMMGSILSAQLIEFTQSASVYVLADDVALRGVKQIIPDIKQISYGEFVVLCTQYNSSISWF